MKESGSPGVQESGSRGVGESGESRVESRESMEIREERAGDWEGIRRVQIAAFGGDGEARLVDLLRERGKAVISLVAVEANDVVGHILFSPVTIDELGDARPLGLAPVGVLPAFQRSGIGSSLIREGLSRCARAGYNLVVLVGRPRYYARFGFQAAKPSPSISGGL